MQIPYSNLWVILSRLSQHSERAKRARIAKRFEWEPRKWFLRVGKRQRAGNDSPLVVYKHLQQVTPYENSRHHAMYIGHYDTFKIFFAICHFLILCKYEWIPQLNFIYFMFDLNKNFDKLIFFLGCLSFIFFFILFCY